MEFLFSAYYCNHKMIACTCFLLLVFSFTYTKWQAGVSSLESWYFPFLARWEAKRGRKTYIYISSCYSLSNV
jgi:hypothetical protein